MNSLLALVAFALFGTIAVSARGLKKHPFIVSQPTFAQQQRAFQEARRARQMVRDNGCDINLCFAIDGSGSTTPEQFQKQQDFVDLMINILTTDEPGNFCAVQTSTSNRAISPLTGKKNKFIRKLHGATQKGGLSNIAGALGYTGFQLKPRTEDANKIVLLGDGFDSIGFRPKRVSDVIRGWGYVDICAVAVGPSDVDGLTEITGDRNKVVRLRNFFELGEIIVNLVNDVCGYE